ncbi:GNAT family N-acetyltransferase [Nostoc sp. 3335mG]|nr:GNAT family N-acetyltransferase [Nostoc sp. 3335mG]
MTTPDIRLLITRDGVRLNVRPARGDDEARLADFFARVTPEDLRFRFLTGIGEVSRDRLAAMTRTDDDRTLSLIALDDDGSILAAAMLAGDDAGETAEAAIALRGDMKQRGIGWTLLDHLVTRARDRGYRTLEAIEDRENRSAIAIEHEMGFERHPIDDDPTLVRLSKTLRSG